MLRNTLIISMHKLIYISKLSDYRRYKCRVSTCPDNKSHPNILGNLIIDNLIIDNLFIDNLFIDNIFIDNLFIDNLFIDNIFIDNLFIDNLMHSNESYFHEVRILASTLENLRTSV